MTPQTQTSDHGNNNPTLLFTVDPGTHSATITDLLVAQDGAAVITVGMDKRVRWWDIDEIEGIEYGAEAKPLTMLGQIGTGSDGAVIAAAVHPSSGIVVTAVRSEFAGGSVLRLRIPWLSDWQRTFRWSGSIADLVISPDGLHLVVASADDWRSSPSNRNTGDSETARLEVFLFDDLLPAASDSPDLTARATSAAEMIEPPEPLHRESLLIGPGNVGIGPEVEGISNVVVTPTFVGRPQLFELSRDRLVERTVFAGGDGGVPGQGGDLPAVGLSASVAVTQDHIALAGENTGLTILDTDGRVVAANLQGAGGGIPVGVAFSPDGSLLVVGSRAGARSEITVHDVYRDGEIVGRRSYDDNAIAVGFRNDYRVVSAGGSRFSIHTWDPLTTEPQPYDQFLDGAGQVVDAVGVSGTQIGFGNPDPVRPNEPRGEVPTLARRFDLKLLSLVPGADEHTQVVPLDDFDRAVHQWSTGKELELDQGQVFLEPKGIELAGGGGFSGDQATSYGFVADQQVVVGRRSGAVTVFVLPAPTVSPSADLGGAVPSRVLPNQRLVGHVSAVLDLAVGDRWLVTAGRDQVIRLWSREQLLTRDVSEADPEPAAGLDVGTVEPVLSLFVTATNEWVIWSRSGYYASSQNGDRYISYHYNRGETAPATAYSGDQFVKNLYRPDVIRSILELGSEVEALEALAVTPFSLEASLPPDVYIVGSDITFGDDGSAACLLQFEVTDAARPTTRIIVLQNGVPAFEIAVADQPGEIIDVAGPVRRYEEMVFLEPGENKLSILAENDAARSGPAEEILSPSVVLPTESVSLPPASEVEHGEVTAEAIELTDVVEEDLTRGRVTGAELNIALQIAAGDEPLMITATRNHETVWAADVDQGVGFDGQLSVPLHRGYNNVEVFAEGETANGVLFSGQVDLTPRYTVEQDDPGTEIPEEPEPGGGRVHVVADGETLRLLALQYYGHESRYPLIFEANPRLVDLDRLLAGTELVIPVLQVGIEDDNSTDEIDLAGWHAAREVTATPQQQPGDFQAPASGVGNMLSSDPAVVEQEPGSEAGRRKGTGGTPRDLPPASDSGIPNLYLLSIGVSNLASRSEGFTNLSWPGDDAAAIADRFRACEGDQFGQVHQIGLGPRNVIEGADATKANIEQAVADLAAAVKARAAKKREDRVGTTDVTVLFFSGHGMSRLAGEGEQEGLFLIPHDYDQDRWQETSVSLLGIAETLCTLPKTELIIFIDACRSGFAGTDFAQRIKPEQFGKRVEAISPRTIYVLSSTARDLDSWEFGLKYPYSASAPNRRFVGHGLFTHAILKRMDEADSANRGLSILELGASVHRQFETWRSWKAFADIDVRQDPWYQFHRSVRHFEFYRKSR